jgi:hypothetical protein
MRRPHFEITDYGQGPTAFVHTRVELFYRRFLDETDADYNNDEVLFDAHLKAIIWGVLYIEGLVNYKLYALTASHVKRTDLADGYWELTKQSRIQDKIDLVFSSDQIKRLWLKDLKKKFMRMVEERNRLVHFKEVPTPFDLPTLVAKLGVNAPSSKWSEHTPYPKIVSDLLATPLSERIEVFRSLGDALESVQTTS